MIRSRSKTVNSVTLVSQTEIVSGSFRVFCKIRNIEKLLLNFATWYFVIAHPVLVILCEYNMLVFPNVCGKHTTIFGCCNCRNSSIFVRYNEYGSKCLGGNAFSRFNHYYKTCKHSRKHTRVKRPLPSNDCYRYSYELAAMTVMLACQLLCWEFH